MTDLAEAVEEQPTDTIATLDGVFDEDQTTDEPEAEQVTADEAEETEAEETKDEEVKGDTSEEEEAEPPAADEDKSVPIAALQDERRKRQELEERLAKYEQKEAPQIEEVDDETYIERANLSREVYAEAFPDYEAKEKVFLDLAQDDPFLKQQVRQAKNPAKFAYEKAKEHLEITELKELRGSDDWNAFQQWKKDQLKPKEDPRKASAVKVPDLTKATAKGSNSTPVEKEETLDDVLGDAPF